MELKDLVLEHYSAHPLEWPARDYTQTYDKPGWGYPPKPEGLWLSVKGEDDWPSWCKDEGFREEALAICTRIHLADDAKIKLVSGRDAMLAFDAEYGVDWRVAPEVAMHRIDWVRLATEYDGIIIAPYVWSLRMGDWEVVDGVLQKGQTARISDWYYPWDVASGCIWNGRAVKAFEQINQREAA